MLRISGAIKAEIKAAAESAGQSMTTFITDAALKRAHQVKSRPAARAAHGAVSTHFRSLCFEAANGGASGYGTAGWHLAASAGTGQPADTDAEEWERKIDALKALIANQDDEAAWEWFCHYFPKFMALIPARRREQFLYGVRRAYDEDLIGV